MTTKSIFERNVPPSVLPAGGVGQRQRRGTMNTRQAERDCTAAIQSMDCWSWADYVASLEDKGYNIRERWDSKGILHGYTLRKGNIIIKASELKGRAFTASRLEDTWRKLNTQKMSDVPTQRTVRTSRTCSGDNDTAATTDSSIYTAAVESRNFVDFAIICTASCG